MDFSFSPEQDDLRREARVFLEANPSPSDAQLEELGWKGMLASDDFTFLDAGVLFEELGRVLYEGTFVEDEVGDDPLRLGAAYALVAVGIGGKATELAIAYASDREQFGKKIGTYQAISHSIVDAYVAVELARSLAYWAAWCVAEGDEQARLAVAAAKSQAGEAAVLACEKSIQVHGGIGFTWEHPLHRYYKRALRLEGALGYGREHRAEIAQSLLSS
ncbi:MAG TPA: acyl-CoA dehydrogenase family protein [Gaiellaceae bacterium]|nr:acyl-CoA dehydrogenase family protein [Gaiellaceae bacterium]